MLTRVALTAIALLGAVHTATAKEVIVRLVGDAQLKIDGTDEVYKGTIPFTEEYWGTTDFDAKPLGFTVWSNFGTKDVQTKHCTFVGALTAERQMFDLRANKGDDYLKPCNRHNGVGLVCGPSASCVQSD